MSDHHNSDPIRSAGDMTPEEQRLSDALLSADRTHGLIAVTMLPSGLFQMLSEVQLALRHPRHPAFAAAVAEAIARGWQRALARHVPELTAIMEQGWDRAQDVRMTEEGRPSAPGPRGRVRADGSMVAETVEDRLYIDQWDMTQGRGHVGGPQCPHCGKDVYPRLCLHDGYGVCGACDGTFRWSAGFTRAGFAWTTCAADTPEEGK